MILYTLSAVKVCALTMFDSEQKASDSKKVSLRIAFEGYVNTIMCFKKEKLCISPCKGKYITLIYPPPIVNDAKMCSIEIKRMSVYMENALFSAFFWEQESMRFALRAFF